MSSARSSPGSAAAPAPSRWCPATTPTRKPGTRPCRCCSRPAVGRPAPERNTGHRPRRNATSSSPLRKTQAVHWHLRPRLRHACIHEHVPASGARSCGQTQPSAPGSRRSAPFCTTASPKAEREGWLGEADGLKVSLAGADDKLTQIDAALRRQATTVPARHARIPRHPSRQRRPGPLTSKPDKRAQITQFREPRTTTRSTRPGCTRR